MLTPDGKLKDALWLSRSASAVQRFHTAPLIKENTVGQHTFNVIGILLLCVPPTALRWQLLAAAWQHDVPEAVCGDVPSPTKRALGGMDTYEADILREQGMENMADYLHPHELQWIKLADSLEGWMLCLQEAYMGNLPLLNAAGRNFRRYVREKLDQLGKDTVIVSGKAHMTDEQVAHYNFSHLVDGCSSMHRHIEVQNGLR